MSGPVLDVRDVYLRRGAQRLLAGVTFSVPRGAVVALMGPSGSGKTSILRAIAALDPFDGGSIAVGSVMLEGGRRPDADTLRKLRRQVGLVFQFHHLFEHLSSLDNVTLAPVHAHDVPARHAERDARELLRAMGVAHRAEALPRELSGGEAQRVAIARALAVNPPLLMMDEPTASLDPARRNELGELLAGLARQDRAILVSTHDEDFARDWAGAILRVRAGTITSR
jgi:ABC-type polar amino acid transport system ATPase subunit